MAGARSARARWIGLDLAVRPLDEVIDEIESILLADGTVSNDLTTELLCALPAAERALWLGMLMGLFEQGREGEWP